MTIYLIVLGLAMSSIWAGFAGTRLPERVVLRVWLLAVAPVLGVILVAVVLVTMAGGRTGHLGFLSMLAGVADVATFSILSARVNHDRMAREKGGK